MNSFYLNINIVCNWNIEADNQLRKWLNMTEQFGKGLDRRWWFYKSSWLIIVSIFRCSNIVYTTGRLAGIANQQRDLESMPDNGFHNVSWTPTCCVRLNHRAEMQWAIRSRPSRVNQRGRKQRHVGAPKPPAAMFTRAPEVARAPPVFRHHFHGPNGIRVGNIRPALFRAATFFRFAPQTPAELIIY